MAGYRLYILGIKRREKRAAQPVEDAAFDLCGTSRQLLESWRKIRGPIAHYLRARGDQRGLFLQKIEEVASPCAEIGNLQYCAYHRGSGAGASPVPEILDGRLFQFDDRLRAGIESAIASNRGMTLPPRRQ